MPAIVLYTFLWHGDDIAEAWPDVFDLSYIGSLTYFEGGWNGSVFGCSVILYLTWWTFYVSFMLLIGLDLPKKKTIDGVTQSEPRWDTVFHSTMRGGACVALGRTFRGRSREESLRQMEENSFDLTDFGIYMGMHAVGAVMATALIGYGCFTNQIFHRLTIVLVVVLGVVRGAKRYTYYATMMYSRALQKEFESTEEHNFWLCVQQLDLLSVLQMFWLMAGPGTASSRVEEYPAPVPQQLLHRHVVPRHEAVPSEPPVPRHRPPVLLPVPVEQLLVPVHVPRRQDEYRVVVRLEARVRLVRVLQHVDQGEQADLRHDPAAVGLDLLPERAGEADRHGRPDRIGPVALQGIERRVLELEVHAVSHQDRQGELPDHPGGPVGRPTYQHRVVVRTAPPQPPVDLLVRPVQDVVLPELARAPRHRVGVRLVLRVDLRPGLTAVLGKHPLLGEPPRQEDESPVLDAPVLDDAVVFV
ncbi:hypothetical protein THAOC_05180 [Thalassiosira oceanica]|uniref:Uncharacterized protein n=1 Tax=Thalassiosira oceanica TaxID=159749 RepID=K0TN61_THAOC|nr:hypothetical protein THAOC_05180 [Thalassiosira oceanica]|eukprot:EJK73207.1 hypothetical protein THAOC_05180 [Thalassiosira oceanica]